MASSPGSGTGTPERIEREIRASGNLGLTSSQLARSTGAPAAEVARALERLRRARRITRVGHGLWLDPALLVDPGLGRGYVPPSGYLHEFAGGHRLTVDRFDGEIQFRPNTDEPVHRWWPYVQGFSAGFVRHTLDRYRLGPGSTVLDPFAGSGTVPVAARTAGAASVGVELMPISAFVAEAKHAWTVDPSSLERAGARILAAAPRERPAPLPFLRETRRQFAEGPLDSLRRLRTVVASEGRETDLGRLLSLAFARILVDSSRMRRSPCLGYGPKEIVPRSGPYRLYADALARTVEDLRRLRRTRSGWGPRAKIVEADIRETRLPSESIDIAITSPPYVNGMDYVMNYKLELAWLGFASGYADLRALKDRMVACDNLPKSAAQRGWGDAGLGEDPWMKGIVAAMQRNLRSKATYRRNDMDGVVVSYFSDLRPMIAGVFRSLRPGGRFVVVNGDSFLAGVYVPGDLIFARIGEAEGFHVERFEIARTRRSGQRRDFLLRESILTLSRP